MPLRRLLYDLFAAPDSRRGADVPAFQRAFSLRRALARPAWSMLRQRTLLIVALSLGVVMIGLYFPLRLLLLQNAVDLETRLATLNAGRAVDALDASFTSLANTNISYAYWDETYAFALNGDPTYPEVNQNSEAFIAEERDLVAVVARDGALRLLKAVDSRSGLLAEPPALPLTSDSPLITQGDDDERSGMLLFAGRPLWLVSSPILKSDATGPSAGTLIMGRWLDEAQLEQLSATVSLPIEIAPYGDPRIPAEVGNALLASPAIEPIVVRPLDDSRIAGYALIRDLYDQPALVLRIVEPRQIYAQGQTNALLMAAALLIAGLVVGGAIMVLLEQVLLSRIARLSAEVSAVGQSGDGAGRVTVDQNDELTRLASDINAMLATLEQVQQQRQATADEQLRLQAQLLQVRRQVLSQVTHELRTPLTPIKGFADLMLRSPSEIDPDTRMMLGLIRNNAERMSVLIDDLMELGKADSGQLRLKLAEVRLDAIIGEAIDVLRPSIEQKQLRLTLELADQLPAVEADAPRLSQVFVNLISNAVKYTHAGGWLAVRAAADSAESVAISVQDSGVGMSAEQLQQLFTPFFRAQSELHTSSNGTGLGLIIARSLVELHQGTLDVTSVPGIGSTFTVRLPIWQGVAESEPDTP